MTSRRIFEFTSMSITLARFGPIFCRHKGTKTVAIDVRQSGHDAHGMVVVDRLCRRDRHARGP